MFKVYKKFFFALITIVLVLFFDIVFAKRAPGNIGTLGDEVMQSFIGIGKALVAVSYLAGIGFGITAMFKFKQHKDNPTQVPIGAPLVLITISSALIFIPMLFGGVGKSLFAVSDDKLSEIAGGFTGAGVESIPDP